MKPVQQVPHVLVLASLLGGCESAPLPISTPLGRHEQALQVAVSGLYAASADLDGDGLTDRVLWDPNNGRWFAQRSRDGELPRGQGTALSGDTPVAADYDGDGRTDLAVYQAAAGRWLITSSVTGQRTTVSFGSALEGDVPAPGDYDGDGRADLAVWNTMGGEWTVRLSGGGTKSARLGDATKGDMSVPRDYDGDGKTDFAVWRPSTGRWSGLLSAGGTLDQQWGAGQLGDTPVPADYDGDGKVDCAVRRASTNQWFVKPSSGAPSYGPAWGDAAQGDLPVVGADFDGDDRADMVVYRPSSGMWKISNGAGRSDVSTPVVPASGRMRPVVSLGALSVNTLSTRISGFADLHVHMMAEEAFAGGWMHGKHEGPGAIDDCSGGLLPGDHARVRSDLSSLLTCPESIPALVGTGGLLGALFSVGGVGGSELIGATEGTQGDTGLHLRRKEYGEGWPRWDNVAHHQVWVEDLRQAHAGGLNVMVMSATSYKFLCEILPPQNRKRPCDEMVDAELQIQMTRDFAARHADWVEIAESPVDVRRIVSQGKLAIILAVEVTHLFGDDVDDANLVTRLDRLYDLGVRSLQLVHQEDGKFAGAAHHHAIFQAAQYTRNCHIDTDCGVTTGSITLGFDVDAQCKNVLGLTPLGRRLAQEMMSRHMLIDASHLSERAANDLFDLSAAAQYYPVFYSHGHFREIMTSEIARTEKSVPASLVQRLRRTGGMFGLRTASEETHKYAGTPVPNDCHGSSRSFAQALEFGQKGLKVDIALGTDFQGFKAQTRPRFGDMGACSAGSRGEAECQAQAQRHGGPPRVGTDFDEKGLAHIGLVPDLLTDLRNMGVDTTRLMDSAETFVRMWERTYEARQGPVTNANDTDVSGILVDRPADERADDYPEKCGKAYCDRSLALGASCEFNDECESGQCTALLCGTTGGRCVCDQDYDCPDGEWCDRDLPLTDGDNRCRAGKGDHDTCVRDNQCASGHCGGLVTPDSGFGWCYTPHSKDYDQGCRSNDECKSDRCGDLTQLCKCKVSSDCPGGQYCGTLANDGECRDKKGNGSACRLDMECQSGACGNIIAGVGTCYAPYSKDIGQGCLYNNECKTGRCVDLTRKCGCTSNDQCGGDYFCGDALNAGECVHKRGNGEACDADYKCMSNRCADVGHYCRKPK